MTKTPARAWSDSERPEGPDELQLDRPRSLLGILSGATRRALATHGIRGSFARVPHYFDELFFDLRYGVRTAGCIDFDASVDGEKVGNAYDPIEARNLRRAIRRFHIPANQTFVDLGCGKGRALVLAAAYGFPRVRGVDFVREFCEEAEENLERWKRATRRTCEVEVVAQDARQYVIRPDEGVFFLFNPFPAAIMRVVVDNIRRSVLEVPRDVWVVYANPLHEEVFDDPFWHREAELPGPGHETFVLYRRQRATTSDGQSAG